MPKARHLVERKALLVANIPFSHANRAHNESEQQQKTNEKNTTIRQQQVIEHFFFFFAPRMPTTVGSEKKLNCVAFVTPRRRVS